MRCDVTVTIAGNNISTKRYGQSETTKALILGTEIVDGVEHIYVDRLIHEHHEKKLAHYDVRGAISSILSAPANCK